MSDILIAFKNATCIARGPLAQIETQIRTAAAGDAAAVIVLNAETSAVVDIPTHALAAEHGSTTGPGRPKLGVISREVSLLPRHWEWLAGQSGGASAALRRLVEQARRGDASGVNKRQSTEAIDRFMHVMAGDLPNFEEASRAFYQDREEAMLALIADWPRDIRSHLEELLRKHWHG